MTMTAVHNIQRQGRSSMSTTRLPRIGLVNLMPRAHEYEGMLLPQFGSGPAFEPVWVRMHGRRYSLDDPGTIDSRYRYYDDVVAERPLDGLVVTGAAVEHLPFEDVHFMPELEEIVRQAAGQQVKILGLCWGALAVGHTLLGLDHSVYPSKVSGVFETDLGPVSSPVIDGIDDRFWTAHSRFSGFDEETIAVAETAGRVRVLARSVEAGVVMAESSDHTVVMHIGHPEYGGTRLAEEYRRDVGLKLEPCPPAHVDLERPLNQWRSHSRVFFANWLALTARGRHSTNRRVA